MNRAQFHLLHGVLFLGCIHRPLGQPKVEQKIIQKSKKSRYIKAFANQKQDLLFIVFFRVNHY